MAAVARNVWVRRCHVGSVLWRAGCRVHPQRRRCPLRSIGRRRWPRSPRFLTSRRSSGASATPRPRRGSAATIEVPLDYRRADDVGTVSDRGDATAVRPTTVRDRFAGAESRRARWVGRRSRVGLRGAVPGRAARRVSISSASTRVVSAGRPGGLRRPRSLVPCGRARLRRAQRRPVALRRHAERSARHGAAAQGARRRAADVPRASATAPRSAPSTPNLFPDSVRALVLDGSVDPAAGEYNIDGTVVGSFGRRSTACRTSGARVDVFLELCDATRSARRGRAARVARRPVLRRRATPTPSTSTSGTRSSPPARSRHRHLGDVQHRPVGAARGWPRRCCRGRCQHAGRAGQLPRGRVPAARNRHRQPHRGEPGDLLRRLRRPHAALRRRVVLRLARDRRADSADHGRRRGQPDRGDRHRRRPGHARVSCAADGRRAGRRGVGAVAGCRPHGVPAQ